jgi:hypothetical protein
VGAPQTGFPESTIDEMGHRAETVSKLRPETFNIRHSIQRPTSKARSRAPTGPWALDVELNVGLLNVSESNKDLPFDQ